MKYILEETKRKYARELQKINDKDNLSPSDLEATYKIIDIIKDIVETCAIEYGKEDMYDNEWSGRSGGRRNMYSGRYSGRSMNNGYSGHSDNMLDYLYDAMNEASDEDERMAIQAIIKKRNSR